MCAIPKSQLQVVAAIRHVLNGNLGKYIEELAAKPVKADFAHLTTLLKAMTEMLAAAVEQVKGMGSDELIDFHARRLVEMGGHIVMGYLLVQDADRNEMFRKSAEIYIQFGRCEVEKHAAYIRTFVPENIDMYK